VQARDSTLKLGNGVPEVVKAQMHLLAKLRVDWLPDFDFHYPDPASLTVAGPISSLHEPLQRVFKRSRLNSESPAFSLRKLHTAVDQSPHASNRTHHRFQGNPSPEQCCLQRFLAA